MLENNAVSSVADSSNLGGALSATRKRPMTTATPPPPPATAAAVIPYPLRIRSTHLHPQPLAILALVQALVEGNLVLLVDEGSVSVLAIASAITPLSTGRWIERIGRGAGEAYFMTAIVAMSCGM
jgi:hypothetical protein